MLADPPWRISSEPKRRRLFHIDCIEAIVRSFQKVVRNKDAPQGGAWQLPDSVRQTVEPGVFSSQRRP
jgi:hypothetical protein